MPNITSILRDLISRLARREVKSASKTNKKASGQFRRDIAGLKRLVADLVRRVVRIEKALPREEVDVAPPEIIEKARFRPQGVKAHRARLGLSAQDYGRLVGVDGQTVYKWEGGKSRPRRAQWIRLLAIRGIGKREASKRLEAGKPKAAGAEPELKPAKRKRGQFTRTGVEMILALVKASKTGLPTAQINAAWKREGRGGFADTTLGQLVRAKKLKRVQVKGQRGSLYKLA